jgi:ABC-type methionine transport system permease subunit
MVIYFVGCVISLVLSLLVHITECKKGCVKDLTSDIIVTVINVILSWVGVIFCIFAFYHYFKGWIYGRF